MRALKTRGRRKFIKKVVAGMLGFVLSFFEKKGAVFARLNFWASSEYVGKTRGGKYKTFYIQYYKSFKRIKAESWRLNVKGLCRKPQALRLDEIKMLPLKEQVSRIKCVECWSAKASWAGFSMTELEKRVEPLPEAVGVLFYCADTYVEYLSLEDLHHQRTLLAHTMNDAPLSDEHGFPLRVIVPYKYGYKSPKAVLEIEFVDAPGRGTWNRIGPYSVDGTILPGYDHPLDRGKKRRRIFGGEIFD
ncbi:MAG: molybdopterin-dependent oxidoreductase [Nitrospiria bacterium]